MNIINFKIEFACENSRRDFLSFKIDIFDIIDIEENIYAKFKINIIDKNIILFEKRSGNSAKNLVKNLFTIGMEMFRKTTNLPENKEKKFFDCDIEHVFSNVKFMINGITHIWLNENIKAPISGCYQTLINPFFNYEAFKKTKISNMTYRGFYRDENFMFENSHDLEILNNNQLLINCPLYNTCDPRNFKKFKEAYLNLVNGIENSFCPFCKDLFLKINTITCNERSIFHTTVFFNKFCAQVLQFCQELNFLNDTNYIHKISQKEYKRFFNIERDYFTPVKVLTNF